MTMQQVKVVATGSLVLLAAGVNGQVGDGDHTMGTGMHVQCYYLNAVVDDATGCSDDSNVGIGNGITNKASLHAECLAVARSRGCPGYMVRETESPMCYPRGLGTTYFTVNNNNAQPGDNINDVANYHFSTVACQDNYTTWGGTQPPADADCVLSAWVADGTCSATCGDGTESFTRTKTTAETGSGTCGALTKTEPCNLGACPAQGNSIAFKTTVAGSSLFVAVIAVLFA